MSIKLARSKGFTLLELLMVVIIIAILAAIALPQYLRAAEKARAAEALNLMATIRSSELRFRAGDSASQYTTDLGALDVDLPGVTGVGDVDATTSNWTIVVNGTDPTTDPNVTATRSTAIGSIDMELNTGTLCADNPVWGIPTSVVGCP